MTEEYRYHPGDVVRVRPDIEVSMSGYYMRSGPRAGRARASFTAGMRDVGIDGKVYEVEGYSVSGRYILFGCPFIFTDEMLEDYAFADDAPDIDENALLEMLIL